jgi:putative tricarboxylic transport membrane protein
VTQKSQAAKGELGFTLSLLAISLVVLYDAFGQEDTGVNAKVGPEAFEFAVGGLFLTLSLLQLISVWRGNLGEPEEIEGGQLRSRPNFKATALVIGGMVYFIASLKFLGYIVAATPLFAAIAFALGERRKIRTFVIAATVTTLTFIAFTKGLNLRLPSGFEFLNTEVSDPDTESW